MSGFLDDGRRSHIESEVSNQACWGIPYIADCARIGHLWFFNTITHEGVKYLWKKCSRCHQVCDAQPLIDDD